MARACVVGNRVRVVLADAKFKIAPSPDFLKAIEAELGEGMIRVIGSTVEREKPRYGGGDGGWKKRAESE